MAKTTLFTSRDAAKELSKLVLVINDILIIGHHIHNCPVEVDLSSADKLYIMVQRQTRTCMEVCCLNFASVVQTGVNFEMNQPLECQHGWSNSSFIGNESVTILVVLLH